MPGKRTTSSAPSPRSERLREASRRRRETEKRELRDAILRAAGELFLEHGYEGFSLRQVAEQIGYSPGTIYLHFDSKDDLLFTLVADGFERFGESLRSAYLSADAPWDRLRAIARAYVTFAGEHPVHYRLMFLQRPDFLLGATEDELSPRIDSFGILETAVREAIDAGDLHPGDPLSTADALWGMAHGVMSLIIMMPEVFDRPRADQTVQRLFELLEQLRRR